MTSHELKNIAKLNVGSTDYRFILWGTSKNKAVSVLDKSVLEDKGVL